MSTNETIRLEGRYGVMTWVLPTEYSNELRKYPETLRLQYLNNYSMIMEKTLYYFMGTMSTPPAVQYEVLKSYDEYITIMAEMLLKTLQNFKGGQQ